MNEIMRSLTYSLISLTQHNVFQLHPIYSLYLVHPIVLGRGIPWNGHPTCG